MFRWLVIACVSVALGLVGILAFSSAGPRADLVLVNGPEIHDLDPGKMSWSHDIRAALGLWEGLLTTNAETLAIEPAVAESYSVSPDGKTWTFHLRPDARWSNGAPVTAEDFRFSWLRVMDPATASDYYTYMFVIAGAEDYYNAMRARYVAAGRVKVKEKPPASQPAAPSAAALAALDPRQVGIHVLDSHTLEVQLVRPVPYFAELLAFSTFLPVHRQSMERFYVDRPGQLPFYDPHWLKPGNLVTNGPFKLTRWEFRYRLVLERNEFYWDAAHVPSERLELLAIEDVNTAFLSYENRQADVLTNLPEAAGPELLRQSRAGRRGDLQVFPVWGVYYYRFNCKTAPLDDPRVRRALSMSIDREAIVKHVTRRGEVAQSSFVTPGLSVTLARGIKLQSQSREGPGWRLRPDGNVVEYVPVEGLPFDPAAARKLLAEAGYGPGGKKFVTAGGEPVKVLLNESPVHRPIAEAIVKMWKDHLGVDVGLEQQAAAIYRSRLKGHQFEVGRANWYTDYGDPTGFLLMFTKDDGNNDGQFDAPEYDRLLKQADDTVDPARRYELIQRAERLLVVEQAGVAPICQMVGQFMFRQEISGIHANPKQQIMLKQVSRRR